ncbi:MAG TPA: hypothetical protein VJ508_19625, partial [Saprospiraceae bacterium]|nr:hypothetical protein [Saprospiraceae bacterium]
ISYLTIKDSVSDMNLDAWTKGFAVFMVVGAAPYFAAAWRNKAALYTNIMSLENGIIHSRYIRKYYNMAGWSIFIQGVFASFIVFTGMQSLLMVSLVLFLAHLVLSELVILHTIRPHFERSMDEFHENQL